MIVRPLRASDVERIEVQAAQSSFRTHASAEYAQAVLSSGFAYTVEHNDRILACYGVSDTDEAPEAGILWALLSSDASRHLVRLTRLAFRTFETAGKRSLYATCVWDFDQAQRWLLVLGFRFVKRLKGFGLDGADHLLYERVL